MVKSNKKGAKSWSHKDDEKADKGGNRSKALAYGKIQKRTPPRITTDGDCIRISHREFLRDVESVAAGEVSITYLEANPGLPNVCPWLSKIAENFESYTFNRLNIEYVPMCPATAAGSIVIAPDYDVSDYVPASIQSLMTFPNSVRTSVWQGMKMECDPRSLKKLVYERMVRGDEIEDVDLKLYDACVLYFGISGTVAVAPVGSLWIEYDVTLRTPSLDTSVSLDACARCDSGTGTTTKAKPLGDAFANLLQSAYEPIIEYVDHQTVRFLRTGEFAFRAALVGTGLNTDGFIAAFPSNADGILGPSGSSPNAAGTSSFSDFYVNVLRPCVMTIASAAAWTTLTVNNMRISAFKNAYA